MGEERADRLAGRVKRPHEVAEDGIRIGRILHSPICRGHIANMELPPLTDGMTLIQQEDIATQAEPNIGGCSLPIFSNKDLRWRGQPILAVTGESPDAIDDWLSQVKLEIHESAAEPFVGNEFQREKGNSSEMFQNAFQVIEENIVIPLQEGKRKYAGVSCLKKKNFFQLHVETIWPSMICRTIARILHVPIESVEVHSCDTGGGQSRQKGLWYPVHASIIAALLSQKADHSVCIPPSEIGIGPSLSGAELHLKGAINAQGQIIALNGDITINTGAFLPFEDEQTTRLILGLFSVYSCPNYSIKGRTLRHPISPSTLGAAAGFELGYMAGELLASRIADTHLLTPSEWKRHSTSVSTQIIGPGIVQPKRYSIPTLLEKLLKQSDYERKSSSYDQIRLNREKLNRSPDFFRGIGIACAWFGNGFIAKDLNAVSLSITLDRNGILTISLPAKVSQIIMEIWTGLAEKSLGIAVNRIRFEKYKHNGIPMEGPAIFGNHVSIYAHLLELAFNDLLKRRFRETLPITIHRSYKPSRKTNWDANALAGSPFEKYSWGAGAVEVVLSSLALTVESVRIWLQLDAGQILKPHHALATVECSVESALQWCYNQPNSTLFPQIDIQFFNDTSKRRPTDLSTLPWLLIPSAFIKAIRQASGHSISSLPVTPEQIHLGIPYL